MSERIKINLFIYSQWQWQLWNRYFILKKFSLYGRQSEFIRKQCPVAIRANRTVPEAKLTKHFFFKFWNVKVHADHDQHEIFRPSNVPDCLHDRSMNVLDRFWVFEVRFLFGDDLKTLRNGHETTYGYVTWINFDFLA